MNSFGDSISANRLLDYLRMVNASFKMGSILIAFYSTVVYEIIWITSFSLTW